MKALPTGGEVIKQAVTMLAAAAVVAFIVGQLPGFKTWMRKQWE